MKIVMWAAFAGILLVLWGREILAFGAARREKSDFRRDELRFRRRTLGLFVLLCLGLLYEGSHIMPYATPVHELSYYGVFVITLIWLLIIAARDFQDIAGFYVEKNQEQTLQTLVDLEEEIHRLRSRDPGNQPIPRLDFSGDASARQRGEGNPGEPAERD